jgi:carbon storage regulator
MLILTRRPGETLIVETPDGERITVTVLEVKGNQVKIGTDAPDDVSIVRKELLEKLPAES